MVVQIPIKEGYVFYTGLQNASEQNWKSLQNYASKKKKIFAQFKLILCSMWQS